MQEVLADNQVMEGEITIICRYPSHIAPPRP